MGAKMSDLREWIAGYNGGVESVMEFLKEVKNIHFKQEFIAWSLCDSFTNWKGEEIDKCEGIIE